MKSFILALLIAFASAKAAAENSFTVALPEIPQPFKAYPNAVSQLVQVIATQLADAPRPIGDVSVLLPAQAKANPEEQQQAVQPAASLNQPAPAIQFAKFSPTLPTIHEEEVVPQPAVKPAASLNQPAPVIQVKFSPTLPTIHEEEVVPKPAWQPIPERPAEDNRPAEAEKPAEANRPAEASPISVSQALLLPAAQPASGSQGVPVETLPPLGIPILPIGTVGGASNLPTGAFPINPATTITGIVTARTPLPQSSAAKNTTTARSSTSKGKSSATETETDTSASQTMTTDNTNGAAKVTGWGTAMGAVFGILALIV